VIILNANMNSVPNNLFSKIKYKIKKTLNFLKFHMLGCYEYLPWTSKIRTKLLYTPMINAYLLLIIIISKIFLLMFISV